MDVYYAYTYGNQLLRSFNKQAKIGRDLCLVHSPESSSHCISHDYHNDPLTRTPRGNPLVCQLLPVRIPLTKGSPGRILLEVVGNDPVYNGHNDSSSHGLRSIDVLDFRQYVLQLQQSFMTEFDTIQRPMPG